MMANLLVQEQTHRKPNISIHQTTSTQNETLVPRCHSVDEDLFFYQQDTTSFLHFLQKFATEPQVSVYHASSQKCADTNSGIMPPATTVLTPDLSQEGKIDGLNINCDLIEPVIAEEKIRFAFKFNISKTKNFTLVIE